MLITSAINPFKNEFIQLLTTKKPKNLLKKNCIRHLESFTRYSSLVLGSLANIIHLATVAFAIVSVTTGPLFIAVVITGNALAALAVVLAIASAILYHKLSSRSTQIKKSDLNDAGTESIKNSIVSGKENVARISLSKAMLLKEVSDLQTELADRDISQNNDRFFEELKRRHTLITKLENKVTQLTVINESLEDEVEYKKEKIGKIKDQLKCEIQAKESAEKQLKEQHDVLLEILDDDINELNIEVSQKTNCPKAETNVPSATHTGEITPRQKQLIGQFVQSCVDHTVPKEKSGRQAKKKKSHTKKVARRKVTPPSTKTHHPLVPKLDLYQQPIIVSRSATASPTEDTDEWVLMGGDSPKQGQT